MLLDIAENTEGVEKDPEPSVYLTEFLDHALEFVIVTWVDSPKKKFTVETKINEEIYRRFNEEGIQIPYPTQDIYLRNSK